MKAKKIVKRILLVVLAVAVVALVGTCVYMAIPLSATSEAHAVMTTEDQTVFVPSGAQETDDFEYGLVFYPGAKVEPAAYAPLLQKLADKGWLCVVVDAPFHFALANMDAATAPIAAHPNVRNWYVGGHSLGGVVASYYAANHADELTGLVLLAAWSEADLSGTTLDVVGVRGSRDGVFEIDKAQAARGNLPVGYRELVIEGGNHAQFGNYGAQAGDNAATISSDEQQQDAADFIAAGTSEKAA